VIESIGQLDDILTTPSPAAVEAMAKLSGRLMIVGAGGKMGPTLAVLARRAADLSGTNLEVVAASRFSNADSRAWLHDRGVTTIAADVLNRHDIEALPNAKHVIYLVGLKFGTSSSPGATWVANTLAPAAVIQKYRDSSIIALSTGNVYPFVDATSDGSTEDQPLIPIGEYPNAAVARERIFEFFSEQQNTPVALLRLNYALDLRYGVLVDIARKVWNREPIQLSMGYFNAIWQGDANELILRAFPLAGVPAVAYNLTSPQKYSVREVAQRFGERMGRQPILIGTESSTALLSNCSRLYSRLSPPSTSLDTVIDWTAKWIAEGRALLGKPTHFEVRDGVY
jgi:nucleoside-diphosphate-sugar epimerase